MHVKRLVPGEAEPLRLIALLGLPALVAASAFALRLVSSEVLDVLVVWTAASVPIGVLVGHCVLREH
jgi:hypothetical protein